MGKNPTSTRLSDEAEQLVVALAEYLHINKTSVWELAIRLFAKQEGWREMQAQEVTTRPYEIKDQHGKVWLRNFGTLEEVIQRLREKREHETNQPK